MLAALVEVGRQTRLSDDDQALVEEAVATLGAASGYDVRVSFMRNEDWQTIAIRTASPEPWARPGLEELTGVVRVPIETKGEVAGILEARNGTAIPPADRAIFESLAGQLSIALENQRLYRELRGLFGRYTSPEVANALLSGDTKLDLGGSVAEVTVLFADLKGFTSFSERVAHPEAVVELLNRYLSAAVPVVRGQGGTVDKFVGDAMMALFNTPVLQPDHALRAAPGRPPNAGCRCGSGRGPVLPDRPQHWPGSRRQHRQRRSAELHCHRRRRERCIAARDDGGAWRHRGRSNDCGSLTARGRLGTAR